MLVGVALICFAYCPFLLMLKDPPHRTEQEKAEQEVGVIQIQYKNLSTGFNRFLAVSYYNFSHTMIYFRTTILFRSYFFKWLSEFWECTFWEIPRNVYILALKSIIFQHFVYGEKTKVKYTNYEDQLGCGKPFDDSEPVRWKVFHFCPNFGSFWTQQKTLSGFGDSKRNGNS